jgi:hypothetical protein
MGLRQLGDVNCSQRQLGATTISRSAVLVAILKNQIAKKASLVWQRNNSEKFRKYLTICTKTRHIRYEYKYKCLSNSSNCVRTVTSEKVVPLQIQHKPFNFFSYFGAFLCYCFNYFTMNLVFATL